MADSILEHATDEQLELAVEENLYTLFRAMSALPGSSIEETKNLSRHLTFPTNPMYKGVWHTNIMPENIDQTIYETIDWSDQCSLA